MGMKFNPLIYSGFDLVNPSGGVPTVPVVGDLPPSGSEGQLVVVQDTGYIYEWRNTPTPGWVIVAGPGVMLGIGPIDSETPSADGAVDSNNALVLQSASDTVPGLVNNTTQTFSGDKTIQGDVHVTGDETVDGQLTVGGDGHIVGTLTVDTDAHIVGNATIDDAAHIQGDLTVDGNTVLNGPTTMNSDLDMTGHGIHNVLDPVNPQDAMTLAYGDATYIPLSQKGQPNGVAELDGGGKVPIAQLPNSIMEFQGSWDASTNTPTLTDGVGNAGDVYRVSVAGTPSGFTDPSMNTHFGVGDWAMYDGAVWQKSPATDSVVSVNGLMGIVLLTTDDIPEGTTNLYFTDVRAQTAAVVDSMAGTQTNMAPSVASVRAVTDGIATDITNLDARVTTIEGDYFKKDGSVPATGDFDLDSHLIHNVLDPVDPQDAATKASVDAAIASIDLTAYFKKDGSVVATGDFDLGTHQIHNVVDPTADQDAATKKYVDDSELLLVPYMGATGPVDLNAQNLTNVDQIQVNDEIVGPTTQAIEMVSGVPSFSSLLSQSSATAPGGFNYCYSSPSIHTFNGIQYGYTAITASNVIIQVFDMTNGVVVQEYTTALSAAFLPGGFAISTYSNILYMDDSDTHAKAAFSINPLTGLIVSQVSPTMPWTGSQGGLECSPDGKILIFHGVNGIQSFLIDAGTGNLTLVSNQAGGGYQWQPHFTPNGKWVITGEVASGGQIYSIDPITAVLGLGASTSIPQCAISPDGKHIYAINGTIWAIDQVTGVISSTAFTWANNSASGGGCPVSISEDGKVVFGINQAGVVSSWSRNATTGQLTLVNATLLSTGHASSSAQANSIGAGTDALLVPGGFLNPSSPDATVYKFAAAIDDVIRTTTLRIADGSQGNVGDVFTSIDVNGTGQWKTPLDGGLFLKKDGSVAATGNLDLGTHKLINVVDPTAAQDAATKIYVDTADALRVPYTGATGNVDLNQHQLLNVSRVGGNNGQIIDMIAAQSPFQNLTGTVSTSTASGFQYGYSLPIATFSGKKYAYIPVTATTVVIQVLNLTDGVVAQEFVTALPASFLPGGVAVSIFANMLYLDDADVHSKAAFNINPANGQITSQASPTGLTWTGSEGGLTCSADGKILLFCGNGSIQSFLVASNGNLTAVNSQSGTGFSWSPHISPNGNWALACANQGGTGNIYSLDPVTGVLGSPVGTSSALYRFAFSPDGKHIYSGNGGQIFAFNQSTGVISNSGFTWAGAGSISGGGTPVAVSEDGTTVFAVDNTGVVSSYSRNSTTGQLTLTNASLIATGHASGAPQANNILTANNTLIVPTGFGAVAPPNTAMYIFAAPVSAQIKLNALQIADGSQGTAGYVWTSIDTNGNGHWAVAAAASGANATLSNLTSPTAINQDLLPGSNDLLNIGSSTARWATVNADALDLYNSSSTLLATIASATTPTALTVPSFFAPSGGLGVFTASGAAATGRIDIATGNSSTTTNSQNTGAIFLTTGSQTGASGATNSGQIRLITGNNASSGVGAIFLTTGNATGAGGNAGPINIATGNQTNASNNNTGSALNISTGSVAGTGASGDIIATIGAGSTRGHIRLKDGSEGTVGHVWTSTDTTGAGHWAAAVNTLLHGTILSSGTTWTSPANTTASTVFKFTVVGGGAGGGGAGNSTFGMASGGGAGGVGILYISGLAASTAYTIAIGGAGAGGTTGNSGGGGGTTSITINAVTYSATGGNGGLSGAPTSISWVGAPTGGGTTGAFTTSMAGAPGFQGIGLVTGNTFGGAGGSGILGTGGIGAQGVSAGAGGNASGFGAGGGGANHGTTSGGNGSQGCILVEWVQ